MSKPFQKFVEPRPYSDPAKAAERLIEIAKAIGADHHGRIPVGVWNATFLVRDKASAAEYAAGRDHLIAAGLIEMHGSGASITWGPNLDPADRTEMDIDLKLPPAALGLA